MLDPLFPEFAAAFSGLGSSSALGHLHAQIAMLAERLDALLAADGAARTLLAWIPGFGPLTVRTWLAELPPMAHVVDAALALGLGQHGAAKLVATVGFDAQGKQSGGWAGHARMSTRGNR